MSIESNEFRFGPIFEDKSDIERQVVERRNREYNSGSHSNYRKQQNSVDAAKSSKSERSQLNGKRYDYNPNTKNFDKTQIKGKEYKDYADTQNKYKKRFKDTDSEHDRERRNNSYYHGAHQTKVRSDDRLENKNDRKRARRAAQEATVFNEYL